METRDRFFYSGGSLRDFCRDLDVTRDYVESALEVLTPDQAIVLVSSYGLTSKAQVDRIRRHYVVNPDNVEHYLRRRHWKLVVDSAFVLKSLIAMCEEKQFQEVYDFAKSIGGAFYGWAFEFYVHKRAANNLIMCTLSDRMPVRHKKKPKVIEQRIVVTKGAIRCRGSNEDDCLQALRSAWLEDDSTTYWYPDYHMFPNIDCIAKCTLNREPVLAYIQVTVSKSHDLDSRWLNELDKLFRNKYKKRAYVALLPDRDACLNFKLPSPPQDLLCYRAYLDRDSSFS
jgi:hypothetical protein